MIIWLKKKKSNFNGQERERKINLSWLVVPHSYFFVFVSRQSGRESTMDLGTWLGKGSKDYLAKKKLNFCSQDREREE